MTHAEDYGIFKGFIDEKQARRYDGDPAGQDVPDIDLYAPVLDVKEHYIGSFAFTPGKVYSTARRRRQESVVQRPGPWLGFRPAPRTLDEKTQTPGMSFIGETARPINKGGYMERRDFLGKAGCGLAGLVVSPLAFEAAQEQAPPPKRARYKIEIEIYEARPSMVPQERRQVHLSPGSGRSAPGFAAA